MTFTYPCRQVCVLFFLFLTSSIWAQPPGVTPPRLDTDIPWNGWWTVSTVAGVEAQFNAGRRAEESQKGLSNNELGDLELPDDFLSRSAEEQAWIILKAEREARHMVQYGSTVVTGYLPEGVEASLSAVALEHAQDMADRDYFSHTTLGGPNAFDRIGQAMDYCFDSWSQSENIAWNSVSGGHIIGVPLAFYGFIYDDEDCCGGGHRNLCLKQTGNENYGDPNRIGIVGFGRAASGNGDYFVMDYVDPAPGCSYDIETYEIDCDLPAVVTVPGNVYTDEYLAEDVVASDGTIMSGEVVAFKAGDAVNLNADFEVLAGAIFSAEIEDCPQPTATLQSPVELFASGLEQGRYLTPPHQLIEPPIFRKSHRDF